MSRRLDEVHRQPARVDFARAPRLLVEDPVVSLVERHGGGQCPERGDRGLQLTVDADREGDRPFLETMFN
jgi:hypothetical protein